MALYNPYRNYEKGMDDAYMGELPQQSNRQYLEGYYREKEIEAEIESKLIEAANQQPPPTS